MWNLLDNCLFVAPLKPAEVTEGGIEIPVETQRANQQSIATVLRVSPNVTDIKKGDQIIHSPWGGHYLRVGEDEFLSLERKHVLAIWKVETSGEPT